MFFLASKRPNLETLLGLPLTCPHCPARRNGGFGRNSAPIFRSFSADFPTKMAPHPCYICISGISAESGRKNSSMISHLPFFRTHDFAYVPLIFPLFFQPTFCSFCSGPVLLSISSVDSIYFFRLGTIEVV